MGFLDRFTSKKQNVGKEKKPKHVVADAKVKAEEVKKAQFAAVPAGEAGVKAGHAPKRSVVPAAVKNQQKGESRDAYRILLKGIVSEKASQSASLRQYVFIVAPTANKPSIRSAVAKLYGVTPVRVNILNVRGKAVRYGRTLGRTKNWKKAIVTLKEGQSLDSSS